MKNNLRDNLIGQVFLLAAAISALVMTGSIDMEFASELEILAGPRRYPRIILTLFISMNVLLLAVTFFKYRALQLGKDDEPEASYNRSGKSKALIVFLALGVFVLFFESVGYLLLTGPLLVLVAMMNGAKLSAPTVIVCALLLIVCLVVFRFGINIVLPEGLLGIDMLL